MGYTFNFRYKDVEIIVEDWGNSAVLALSPATYKELGQSGVCEVMGWLSAHEDELLAIGMMRYSNFNPQYSWSNHLDKILSSTLVTQAEKDIALQMVHSPYSRNKSLRQTDKPKTTKQFKHGYVYLVQGQDGYYKVGKTVNVQDRVKTFSIKLPFEIELLCVIESDDYDGLEKRLHEHFASKRGSGEWFRLDQEDVEYIKGLQP